MTSVCKVGNAAISLGLPTKEDARVCASGRRTVRR